MAVTQNVTRSLQDNAPEIAGGMVGVGVPVALREFADVEVGSLVTGQGPMVARLTRPSVVYGIGGGALTGLLWAMDVGPRMLEDFYLAHTITGVTTGVASAAIPKQATTTTTGTQPAAGRTGRQRATADGGGEFAPADGNSDEFGESG